MRYRPNNTSTAPYPHTWLSAPLHESIAVAVEEAALTAAKLYPIQSPPSDSTKALPDTYTNALTTQIAQYDATLRRIGHIASAISDSDNGVVTRAIEHRLSHLDADKRSLPKKTVQYSKSKARKARVQRKIYRAVGGNPSNPTKSPDLWDQIRSMCAQAADKSAKERKWYRSRLRTMCAHSDLEWPEVLAHFRQARRCDNTCNVSSQNTC